MPLVGPVALGMFLLRLVLIGSGTGLVEIILATVLVPGSTRKLSSQLLRRPLAPACPAYRGQGRAGPAYCGASLNFPE